MSFFLARTKSPVTRVACRMLPFRQGILLLALVVASSLSSQQGRPNYKGEKNVHWIERPRLHEVQSAIHASKQTALGKSGEVRDEILGIMGDVESALNRARVSSSKRQHEEIKEKLQSIGPTVKEAKRGVQDIRESSLKSLQGVDIRPVNEFNSRTSRYFMGKNSPAKRLTPVEKTFDPRKSPAEIHPRRKSGSRLNPFRWVFGRSSDSVKGKPAPKPKEPESQQPKVTSQPPKQEKKLTKRFQRPQPRFVRPGQSRAPAPKEKPPAPEKPSRLVTPAPIDPEPQVVTPAPKPVLPIRKVPGRPSPQPYQPKTPTPPKEYKPQYSAPPPPPPRQIRPILEEPQPEPGAVTVDPATGVPKIVEPPRPAPSVRDFNLLDEEEGETKPIAAPIPAVITPAEQVKEILDPVKAQQPPPPPETTPAPEPTPSPAPSPISPIPPETVGTPVAPFPSAPGASSQVELPKEYLDQLDEYSRKMQERQQELLKNLYNINKLISENEEILN